MKPIKLKHFLNGRERPLTCHNSLSTAWDGLFSLSLSSSATLTTVCTSIETHLRIQGEGGGFCFSIHGAGS
jgi:hypothetical protein